MWKFKKGDRVVRGDRHGVVTGLIKEDGYIFVEWDDARDAEDGLHEDTVAPSLEPAPPPKLEPV